jgi:hypothetical protein
VKLSIVTVSDGVLRPNGRSVPALWLPAHRQHAIRGDTFSVILQKSLHGGTPVLSTSISKLRPAGKRSPNSHEFTVETESPRSRAICLRGIRFFNRQFRNAVAKLERRWQ